MMSLPHSKDDAICPVCLADGQTVTWWDGFHLADCSRCGHRFIANPPRYEALTEDYDWSVSMGREGQRRQKQRSPAGRAISRFARRLRGRVQSVTRRDKLASLTSVWMPRGRLLDLGCASGSKWTSFPPDCSITGIEISPTLAEQARQRAAGLSGEVIEADVLGGLRQLESGSRDGSVAISYIEHEARPREVMAELGRVLKPGSHTIWKLPNFNSWNRRVQGFRWCGYRIPDHVNYFTPGSLRCLLEGSGFVLARFGPIDRMPTSDNMWCVARLPKG